MDGVKSSTEVRNTHAECKIVFVYSIAINDDMCTYSTGVFKVLENGNNSFSPTLNTQYHVILTGYAILNYATCTV